MVSPGGAVPDAAERLQRAVEAMKHRGPDAGGVWRCPSGAALLGHRRLAIIDLSSRADQPLVDPETGAAIVFNGEIYNYRELRRELESRGCHFRTTSDTEVLLYAWREWNTGLFDRLEGMFAFAAWDPGSRVLLMARDFCGQKPLYYCVDRAGAVCFSSELRPLLALRGEGASLDPAGLDDYLRYWCIPAPGTLLQGIRKVPAGHYVLADPHGLHQRRYWFPLCGARRWEGTVKEESEWRHLLAAELRRSVAATCVADVPVGIAFSGGSDSVAVAASALQAMQQVRTFSIDVPAGLDREERRIRERFARWGGVSHDSSEVSEAALREWIGSGLREFDEPVSDNTVVLSAVLARQIRAQGYKVFLTGEGGDEVFLGYPWWVRLIRWQRRLQSWRGVTPLALPFLPGQWRGKAVGRMWQRAARKEGEIYWDSQLGLSADSRRALLNGASSAAGGDFLERTRAEFHSQGGTSESQWFTYLDLNLRLPEMLLLRLDRGAMRFSTEARSPLLERRLVELALAIPESVKLRDGRPKGILLQAMRSLVPDELVIRRKVGYNQSLSRQLPNLSPLMQDSLAAWNRSAALFRPDGLRQLASTAGPDVLWPLYALSEWHREIVLRGSG
jgi:asparagine synthase (glutamine-hydrolysing)